MIAPSTQARTWLLAAAVALALPSCATRDTPVDPHAASRTAVARALVFLERTQVDEAAARRSHGRRLAGEWPQRLVLGNRCGTITVRDNTAFTPALVHNALALVHASNREPLALDDQQLASARRMRLAAVRQFQQFRRPAGSHAAGAFGYWPSAGPDPVGLPRWFGRALDRVCPAAPQPGGTLAPMEMRAISPPAYRIWPDADTTAVCFEALRLHHQIDGGPPPPRALDIFSRWRDSRHTTRFAPPAASLPAASGVFLTWFNAPSSPDSPNDADLVVACNVLATLGSRGALDTPGVRATTDWILETIEQGRHRWPADVNPHYQHPGFIHASVARACHLGRHSRLRPAARRLADELRRSAIRSLDGSVHWDAPNRPLATAFAAFTLLLDDPADPLLDGAATFIARHQAPGGQWRSGRLDLGSAANGMRWSVRGDAVTTAAALEFFCRYLLTRPIPA